MPTGERGKKFILFRTVVSPMLWLKDSLTEDWTCLTSDLAEMTAAN